MGVVVGTGVGTGVGASVVVGVVLGTAVSVVGVTIFADVTGGCVETATVVFTLQRYNSHPPSPKNKIVVNASIMITAARVPIVFPCN